MTARRPLSVNRLRQRILFRLIAPLCAIVLPHIMCAQRTVAQMFPDSIHTWVKTWESVPPPEEWESRLGDESAQLEAYGASELRIVTYARGSQSVRIEVVAFPSRERAYGSFRAIAGNAAAGIIGDAFAYERAAVHVNYGPFYIRIIPEDRRSAGQPPNEAFIVRTRRVLFSRADCYGSDFPLPTEERTLGSEQYFAPDRRAWQMLPVKGTEDLLPVLDMHAAFSAEYEKKHAGLRRTVLYFPFKQKEAAAAFAAELVQQIESRNGSRSGNCVLPAFIRAGTVRFVAADAARVFLVIADADDAGCCDWARSLLRH